MSDGLKQYLVYFQGLWINCLLYGVTEPYVVNPEFLINDGRKRAKTWHALVGAKYVTDAGVLLDTAFTQLDAERPPLLQLLPKEENASRDLDFWQRRPGLPFQDLTLAQRKFVVTHVDLYEFFSFDPYWAHQGTKPWVFGKGEKGTMWVCDALYKAHREEALYWLGFADLKNRNLAWMLVALGIIDEADKDCFEQQGDYGFLGGGNADYFRNDATTWEADLDAQVARSLEKVTFYQRRARVLEAAKAKIDAIGGWKAFHTQVDDKVHLHLKETREKKEKIE